MRKIHYKFQNVHLFCVKKTYEFSRQSSISMPCNLTTKSSHFLFDSSQKQVAFLALFILIPILELNTVYSYIGYFS